MIYIYTDKKILSSSNYITLETNVNIKSSSVVHGPSLLHTIVLFLFSCFIFKQHDT